LSQKQREQEESNVQQEVEISEGDVAEFRPFHDNYDPLGDIWGRINLHIP
jgi:hypothetical protein